MPGGDYDKDGDLDLLLGGNPSVLFKNDVAAGGGFVRVSAAAEGEPETILFDAGNTDNYGMQWGDFNGDGNLDMIASDTPNLRLFLNDGSTFAIADPTATGLIVNVNRVWGVTVADYDRDGDVDIATVGGAASADGGGPPHVLRNDNGIFADVGAELVPVPITQECWNPQWVDVDNDGYMDLWLPTLQRNISPAPRCELLFNDFGAELAPADPAASGLEDAVSAIVSVWGDYDNDGFMDVWLYPFNGDNAGPIRLYRNNGDRTFTDVAPALGMDSVFTTPATRGASWGDYNNDGWLDLFVQKRERQASELWHNNGNGTFTDVGQEAGLVVATGDRRTAQFVDYDSDGWLDIFFSGNGTGNQEFLFHNDGGNSNHWIGIRPKGTTGANTAGIGARVSVVTGSQRQIRYVDGGGTGGNFWPHFGLGSATTADSVIVNWPAGGRDFSTNVAADKYYTFQEGVGIVVGIEEKPGNGTTPTGFALSQNYPNPFNPVTKIQFELPRSSSVRLTLINVAGEEVREIANGKFAAGRHTVTLDAGSLTTGVYFYKIEAGDFVAVKKLAIVK